MVTGHNKQDPKHPTKNAYTYRGMIEITKITADACDDGRNGTFNHPYHRRTFFRLENGVIGWYRGENFTKVGEKLDVTIRFQGYGNLHGERQAARIWIK